MLFMGRIESVAPTGEYLLALPAVKLRELVFPPDTRAPRHGDALQILRPDGSVVHGLVGDWGVYAWKEGKVLFSQSDPADPQVSVMIDGIDEADLWPGSQIWIQSHPLTGR